MTHPHIRSAFDRDLEGLQAQILKMGGLVEDAIRKGAEALAARDTEAALAVREGDRAIDALEEAINAEVARAIALNAPVGGDLRTVLAILRLAGALERVGDYAKNIAKRVTVLAETREPLRADASLRRMAQEVQGMLRDALDAFVRRDPALARDVIGRDEAVDQMYNSLFREVLTFMMEDPRTITPSMHLHFIAKNIERMGDLVTNMAEQVVYLVTGERPGDDRPKGDTTAFVGGTAPEAPPPMETRPRSLSPHVLVIEDEPAQREMLAYNLVAEGFRVSVASTGDEGLDLIALDPPDVVVLDWMLPHVSGIEVCRRLRARAETRALPVIMLSARGEESDRVRGLETGADDYVSKPYALGELLARVRAQLRRARPAAMGQVLVHEDILLDAETHRVTRGAAALRLGPTEFRLLAAFLERPGRVWSREQLLDRVWGRDAYVDTRTVDVHVGRLRKALMAEGGGDPIRTVRGAGYALG